MKKFKSLMLAAALMGMSSVTSYASTELIYLTTPVVTVVEGSPFQLDFSLSIPSLSPSDGIAYKIVSIDHWALNPSDNPPGFWYNGIAGDDSGDKIGTISSYSAPSVTVLTGANPTATFNITGTTIDDGFPYNDGHGHYLVGTQVILQKYTDWGGANQQQQGAQLPQLLSSQVTITDKVPEPASMLLIGVGGALMSASKLRKKKDAENSIA